jgi:hypothetical protein
VWPFTESKFAAQHCLAAFKGKALEASLRSATWVLLLRRFVDIIPSKTRQENKSHKNSKINLEKALTI